MLFLQEIKKSLNSNAWETSCELYTRNYLSNKLYHDFLDPTVV